MSEPVTIIRARLIPSLRTSDGSNFKIELENDYPIFNGVGLRLQCAFFERDGKTIIEDASSIIAVTHTVVKNGNTYMSQVVPGPLPSCSQAQWTAGTHQHVEFRFSDVQTALAPGSDYSCVIFGNASDALAGVDFCCKRPMTVLDSGIPEAFTDPENAATILATLKEFLKAQLGDYVKKIMGPGETITFTSEDQQAKRVLGVTHDAINGAQRYDNIEIPPP